MFFKVNLLKQQLRRFLHSLWRYVGYYDGRYYRFVHIENKLTIEPIVNGKIPKILVIASNVYSEQNSALPVVDSKELRKLLKLQSQPNQAALVCDVQTDKSVINKWQFPELESNPLFIFPESILLTKQCINTEVLITKSDAVDSIYAKVGSVTYSGQLKGVINTEKRFAMSIGMQIDKVTTLNKDEKLAKIENGLKYLTAKEIAAFTFMDTNCNWGQLLIKFSMPGIAVISAYLLITSLLLTSKTYYLDYQNESIKEQASDILFSQTKTEKKEQQYLTYLNILQEQTDYSGLLVSLVPVFEQVRLTSVISENGRFIVRGEIEKASAILEQLANQPNIQDAKFDFPVLQSRARERFAISFVLEDKLTIPKVEKNTKSEEQKQNG
ncbi:MULTISPECIES: hypothetical protein [unclassified Pseudoalteromonas]|uniref:hypothetical protein n=1 Tax=unclassified Pseudoalteromonas TaxID=194690 RepID=UPI00386BA241